MKIQFFLLLLSCFFFLGNTSFLEANELSLNGVVVVHIENGKTGTTMLSFSLPDKYFDKEDSLIIPLHIVLSKNDKKSVFSLYTKDLHIEIPTCFSGSHLIVVNIGDYQITRSILL